jgi:hypothetical protein
MSLTIEVVRGFGDKPGPDIACSIFADQQIFRQVGRVAIDQASQGMKIVTITLPGMRPYIRTGKIIRIVDYGREYRARVNSILFSVGRDDSGKPFATCSMTLRMMEVQ